MLDPWLTAHNYVPFLNNLSVETLVMDSNGWTEEMSLALSFYEVNNAGSGGTVVAMAAGFEPPSEETLFLRLNTLKN